jgi:hypothetical protein
MRQPAVTGKSSFLLSAVLFEKNPHFFKEPFKADLPPGRFDLHLAGQFGRKAKADYLSAFTFRMHFGDRRHSPFESTRRLRSILIVESSLLLAFRAASQELGYGPM